MMATTRTAELRRRDRRGWLAGIRAALADSGGVLEPAAKALGVRPDVLHRWLCEPELRSIPVVARKYWGANDTHPGIRVDHYGTIVTIDVDIAPLMEATWSLRPLAPETHVSCQAWPHAGRDEGKVQIGFVAAAGAQMWLSAVGRSDGWEMAESGDESALFLRGAWSLDLSPVTLHGERTTLTFVYFPRDELDDIVARLRAG